MNLSRPRFWFAIAILLLAACTPAPAAEAPQAEAVAESTPTQPEPTDAPEPPVAEPVGPSLIVFSSDRGGTPDIYNIFTVDPDSGEITQVTDSFSFAGLPSISPDGQTIAFFTNDGGVYRVYTVGIDGQDLTMITDFSSALPSWFPSGDRLVFNSDSQTEPPNVPDLYAMNLDGSNLVQIIDSDETEDYWGRVSPDGSLLLFHSTRSGNEEIYVANIDGTDVQQLTDDPAADYSASWSPDGSRILFASLRSGNDDVWVMNADGSNPVQLTTDPGLDGQCAWSPDGSQIVFISNRSGTNDLWLMNADGSNQRQLTDAEGSDIFPDW